MLTSLRLQLLSQAPKLVKLPLKLCPKSIQSWGLREALSPIFAERLKDGDMDFLQGKWLKIAVLDLDVSFCISVAHGKIKVVNDALADSTLSASSQDFILMAARKEDPDTLFFQRRLKIEGDTELGLEVKNLIDSVDDSALPKLLRQILDQLAVDIEQSNALQHT